MIVRAADPETSLLLRRILAGGGVVIMPCDTIYGIVGVVPDAEPRITAIKGRKPTKPYIRLVADESWVSRLASVPVPEELRRFWPGPLTIVLPDRSGGTVALRVPADEGLRALLAALDRPLASTSVNREGEPPLERFEAIREGFEALVDLLVDGGDRLNAAPSTVVDATKRPFRILRQGAVRVPGALP